MKKRITAFLLVFALLFSMMAGTTITAYAMEVDLYVTDMPRADETNKSGWGCPTDLYFIGGWFHGASSDNLVITIGGFTGKVAYCVEPGVRLSSHFDQSRMREWDENLWENGYITNPQLSSRTMRTLIGRILYYGYQNENAEPTLWVTSNWVGAVSMSQYLATQLLIWETVVGERMADFTKVNSRLYTDVHGNPCSPVISLVSTSHPLYDQIMSAYAYIETQVKNHSRIPSFMAQDASVADTVELKWDGSAYTATLTDTNGVLGNYSFSASGVSCSVSGNQLTLRSEKPLNGEITLSANKGMARDSVLTWTDGETGYASDDSNIQDVITYGTSISDPVYAYLKLKSEQFGSAKIIKTSEDGKVDGLNFRIQGNGVDKTVTTANGGQIQVDNLMPGVYTVTEQNYDKYEPQESRQVTVVAGQTATVTFNNTLKRGDLTVTKTAEDGLEQGMKFHLYGTSLSGLPVDEYAIVGSDGKARFQDVLIGTGYTLEEVGTPDRYIVPDKQKADIEWNKVTNKSFDNELKRGDLTVTKTAEDGLEEGMRFHLYGTSYSGIAVDEYATVGSDGKAYFKDILIGTGYTLEEVGTLDRYVVPENQTAAVEWNKVTEKSFDNRLKKWNLTVNKYDSEKYQPPVPVYSLNSETQGDATLAGAVYGIYKGDELIDTYTTDVYGQFTTKYYTCGDDWSLREISPSEGYLLDPTTYHIDAEAKHYTVEYNPLSEKTPEDVIKGKIALIKHTDDGETKIETPEVGAEFEVFLKSAGSYGAAKATERDYLICDENGFAETKELPYGIYTVRQVSGWEGRELLKPFDVYVSQDGQTYRYLINNSEFESYIKIVKTDAETGKAIPYAGAGFQIYDPSGKLVTMTYTYPEVTTIDTFYTNSEGYLITPEMLPYGLGYSIVEVQAPYGYVLNSDPVYFDLTEDNSTEENAVTVVIVTRPNMPQKGKITIGKTGEVFSSVVVSGDIYQPVYEVKGLAGAVYEIIAAEDIYTPDGTLRYAKGTVVDTVTTDESGNAQSKPVHLGKYEVKEITAPYGMVLNEEIRTVELTYAGQEIGITETAASFYNERQKAAVSLDKIMEWNEQFGIGMNGEIIAVTFGLYAAEDLTAADGTVIPADSLLEIVSVDENGHAVFATDLPIGSYYLKEIATDSHYILSDTQYPVVFEYAGQEVATVNISVNDGGAIHNDLIYGTIKGLKIDRETEETIAGAVFGLFRSDETDFTEDTAILTATSGEDGVFVFENIPYGDWIIVELAPAEGFLPNTEIHHVHVTTDEEIIEITVVNDRIPEIGTTATTEDEKQTHPSDAIIIDDVVEYKHLIPGKEYTIKGILMDKATGEPLLVNGEQVVSEVIFVPENPSGEVVVTFVFDGSGITQNTDIVVFESLYKDGIELTVHADIEDEDQTVTVLVPEIGTQAAIDGEKEVCATEVFTLEDTVSYDNLIVGREYTLKGVLMDKTTGEPLLMDGEEVRSETTFTPEMASGEAVVTFTFDAKNIKEDTDIVVFEELYLADMELAVHADIEDEGQTVTVLVPEIGTTATINGEKSATAQGTITIEDVVSHRNLTPGKEYTVKGVLMNKVTGQPFLVNGEEVNAEVTFTPETSSGEMIVPFTFDASGITTETEIVVFEEIFREDVQIAVHADIEDEDQTIILKPVPSVSPKTGENSFGFWLGIGAAVVGGFTAGVVVFLGRKKEDDE